MSSIYDAAFKVLKSVLKEKELFSASLKKCSSGIKKEEFQYVTALSGLFLRNYWFITTLANDILKTDDTEPKIYIGLAFVDIAIKKTNEKDAVLKYTQSKLSLYQIKFGEEKINRFLNAIADKRAYLKEVYSGSKDKRAGFKYLGARNNTPTWVVTGLMKQYDKNIAVKTISSMQKMPKQFGVINTLMNQELEETSLQGFRQIEGSFYEFDSTSSIRKQASVRNGSILPIQLAGYQFVKNLPLIKTGNVTLYFEGRNGVYAPFASKYLSSGKVSLITPNQKDNPELFTKIKPNKPESLDIYLNGVSGIITHLSEKQDLVVYMPRSSNLEQLRRIPEYGILFNPDTLDSIIQNETDGLQDISQYVNEGGYLAYAVETFNIKETLIATKTFLANNKEFELEAERLYFPFEKENSVFYYAILKRK